MSFYDRVKETSLTTGTGTLTLAGAVTGFQSFSVVGNGNTCYYIITNGTNWEVGLGTYTASGTTLSRDRVFESSNSNALVSFTGSLTVALVISAEVFKNDFGNGSDGAVTISTDTNWETNTAVNDTGYVLKQFTSLTINSGKIVTANHRAQAMVVKVTGNCTINGTLSMNAKGAAATPVTLQSRNYYLNNLWGEFTQAIYQIPAVGAAGGLGSKSGFNSDGSSGANGVNGQTGGGGGGAGGDGGTVGRLGFGGDGATGSCFCGGSGGGGGGNDGIPRNATDGAINGGAGGDAGNGSGSTDSAAAGAGNPVGVSNLPGTGVTITPATGGGGGVIILLVGGNLTITGTISANGSAGGSVSGGSARNSGGGGSGGGTIIILYAGTLSNSGTISVSGGAGGVGSGSSLANSSGGAGGSGSIIGPKQVLP